ncbi:DUF6622 family protein [Scandinavium manionii]|uniref:DUF6622 family protein n=1 Tax=Scandinavium manionii TaxID=2926520 RepID=UPI0013594A66|nr:DUF6622 family protein [Scandinavium manionii]MCS2148042.1 hypothetical protein [Scandinavium manionii]MCS2167425.1 hypothetical protein [Scandinavium manionii]
MLEFIAHMLVGTPIWVYVLFVFLVIRGVKARQPATVTLERLSIIPLIFLVWDLYDLVLYRDLSLGVMMLWIAVLIIGAALGFWLIKPERLSHGSAPRTINRPADYSALPLMMAAFAIKYVFGVMAAVSPQTMQQPGMSAAAVVVGGLFAGSFIGKFIRYLQCYFGPTQKTN